MKQCVSVALSTRRQFQMRVPMRLYHRLFLAVERLSYCQTMEVHVTVFRIRMNVNLFPPFPKTLYNSRIMYTKCQKSGEGQITTQPL